MDHSIPVAIPGGKFSRSISQSCYGRKDSIVISGSFFGASSVNHPRNSGVAIKVSDPGMERKLSRTRKMSENIRSVESSSRRIATIPTQKEDITLQWVQMIVNQTMLKSGKAPLDKDAMEDLHFEVLDCKSRYYTSKRFLRLHFFQKQFCSVGEFSSTYSLRVHVPKLEGETHLGFVIKMIPENDPCRAYVFETGLFEKENEVYFDLMPAIKFHCKSSMIEDLIPECVYGSHNMDGAGVLVFKCCGEQGYESCQDPHGLKLEKVRSVVKSMAEFHASGRAFMLKHGINGVRRRYPSLSQDMYSNGMLLKEITDCIESFELLLNFALSSPQNHLAEEDLTDIQMQFGKLKNCDSYLLLNNLRRPSKTGKLTTIVHGELWDRNLLIHQKHNQVKIFDWKNAKLASATLDLAFLMLSSTSYEVREDSSNDLLKSYHQVYCQTLDKLSVAKEEQPSFRELEDDYAISSQVAVLQVGSESYM